MFHALNQFHDSFFWINFGDPNVSSQDVPILMGPNLWHFCPRIGSTDFSILKGYELWMDDGLGGLAVGREATGACISQEWNVPIWVCVDWFWFLKVFGMNSIIWLSDHDTFGLSWYIWPFGVDAFYARKVQPNLWWLQQTFWDLLCGDRSSVNFSSMLFHCFISLLCWGGLERNMLSTVI